MRSSIREFLAELLVTSGQCKMGVSSPIHHYTFKLVHDSFWPPYNVEAFYLCHHPFKTSHFLERSMTYPVRLPKTYWLALVRTNITLWPGFIHRAQNK